MASKTAEEALVSVCDQLSNQAKRLNELIRRKVTQARNLRAEIAREKAKPDPDKERIKSLEKQLTSLEEGITEDQAAAEELGAVIIENCSP